MRAVELCSHMPVEQQVRAATLSRVNVLTEQGLAGQRGQRVVLARNPLGTLCDRELSDTGKALQDM